MKEVDVLLEKIKEIINKKDSWSYQEIEYCINFFMNLKKDNQFNTNSHWVFFEKDEYLQGQNINWIIIWIIEDIKNKFWSYIIDELAIIKFNGEIVKPIFFYSMNKERLLKDNENNLKESLVQDFKFYTWNILQDDLLEDWEWTLAWNQTWSSFDIILRIWEYIFGFNNSQLSIDEIQKNLWISKNDLINEVSKLYNHMK